MAKSIYSYTFKSVIFESVKIKSAKIKIFSKMSGWSQKSLSSSFENDTYESVIHESVNLKCKSIDRLRHRQISNSFWCFINWIAKSQKEIMFTLPSVTLFLWLHTPSLKNQFKNSFPHSKIYLIKKESNYYTLCQNN